MTATANHRVWVWIAAGAAAVLATIAVLAATSGGAQRGALMAGLQRAVAPVPQTPAGGETSVAARAVAGRAMLAADGAAYRFALTPNRASVANRLVLTGAGGQLAGATVSVSFSMPAMSMYNAFVVTLRPSAAGAYAAAMPFVGMAGAWRLDVTVHRLGHPASHFAVADTLRP